MRNVSTLALLFSSALLLAVSCQKENELKPISTNEAADVVNITVNAVGDDKTKTLIDGTAVKWASTEEFIHVFEVATPNTGDVVTSHKDSAEGVTGDSGATMSFGVSMTAKSSEDYSAFNYYAFYPAGAYYSGTAPNEVQITTRADQTPTEDSFDPRADLLMAKASDSKESQPSSLNMQFGRAVAVAKMTIKNLESTDNVVKITFSAKQGTGVGATPINIAGRTAFDLTTGTLVSTYASNAPQQSIVIDCENILQEANKTTGAPVYFTCYPFTLNSTTPGSFKVVVETATHSFTKEVPVSSTKGLAFNSGKATVFAVDMDGIAGVEKTVDLCYAYLDASEFYAAGGTTSYKNITVYKPAHGDAWVTYAIYTNSAIGVRRNDKGDNDSYIQLPIFKDDIKTVKVTLKNVTASQKITLESSKTSSSGTIASLTTSSATVYSFDLSSKSVKTAFFRSNGFQSQVEKIEVYAGTDTRTAFTAPTTVEAELNTDDDDVTNSIDVSWTEVDDAAGYVITLTPDTGNDVVVEADSSPITVTGLAYEMDYLISVQAVPSDYYVNTISDATTAEDIVTTGEDTSGSIALTSSDITMGSNTVQGTNNSVLAYRLGTSDKNGSLTFGSGYSSITFTLAGWATGTRSFSITNGKIGNSSSLSPSAGSPSGTISSNFSTTYSGTEYTIVVTDSSKGVTFSGHRAVVWGFSAVESSTE